MENYYQYLIKEGRCTGEFKIYQGRSGALILGMAGRLTALSRQQIEDLNIAVYELIDFDFDAFQAHYNYTPRLA
jgi:hypothetical protein